MMRSLTLLVLVICVGLSLSATPVRRPHSPGSGPSSSSGSYSTSSNGHPIWVNCGANNDHYKIYSVSVSPSSPRIGHNITISIDGQLDETVSFGYGSVVLNWNGYPILNCTKDLCNTDPLVTCPIQAGLFVYQHNVTLSGNLIPGHYTGKVQLTDQNAAELCCVKLDVVLSY